MPPRGLKQMVTVEVEMVALETGLLGVIPCLGFLTQEMGTMGV